MAKKNASLTRKDKAFIDKHHQSLSPRELASRVKKSYSIVYNYLVRSGSEICHDRAKKKKRPPKGGKGKDGYFNESSRENWII